MQFTIEFLRTFWSDLLFAAPILIFLLVSIALVGFIIGRIEGWSLPDSLYHAFINATTVGYGDFRPTKNGAKFLAILLAFIGLIFTGMIVAIALHAANDAFGHIYGTQGFADR
jgi:voltage-gated potassium channel